MKENSKTFRWARIAMPSKAAAGDCKQQSTIRANAANVDALGNTGAQGNGKVTIYVNPFNGIRSGGPQSQTGWGVH